MPMDLDNLPIPLPDAVATPLAALQAQLREQIYRDTVTPSLLNFQAFEALWPQMAALAPAHLFFVEVDDMKRLNNEYEHEGANRFLEALGEILDALCADNIRAFHMSGDEFLVVTSGLPVRRVEDLASRILIETNQRRVEVAERIGTFSVSIGIAPIDPREENNVARDLAERAVKEAKRQGRNRFEWFSLHQRDQPERITHRQDCPHCQAHFSVELARSVYFQSQNFCCPLCSQSVPVRHATPSDMQLALPFPL